ncbi:hypothetical protein [Methylosinus sp. Sm6]|uniref:hypothetical protein n=1 Tax=Methylosinus sp. Sm6 TaxID=2866948 RepID=UPI001C992B2F|nr:hypothetical protein [Methylosinus sp. Sm6]MBY6239885.1 hypothetical protein [Methylosinus sp. Sm6]
MRSLILQWIAALMLLYGGPLSALREVSAPDLSLAGQYCRTSTTEDGRTPAPLHDHRRDCILCVVDDQGQPLDRALKATRLAPVAVRPVKIEGWSSSDDPTAPLAGWISTWSSRAPPFFS